MDDTQTAQHTPGTPTPWAVWSACKEGPRPLFVVAKGNPRRIIGPVGLVGNSINEADAAFIVLACNAHDELLAACKELLCVFVEGGTRLERLDAIRHTNAAIDKAKPAC